MTDFNSSKTKENLLKAFAGESQARNRYTFAASAAKKEGYSILQDLFLYTANQEIAHAKQFMDKLKEFSGQEIEITASYEEQKNIEKLIKNYTFSKTYTDIVKYELNIKQDDINILNSKNINYKILKTLKIEL